MDNYKSVHLLLDRDHAGANCTRQTISRNPAKYIDLSDFYKGCEDLNDWLIHHTNSLKLKQAQDPIGFFDFGVARGVWVCPKPSSPYPALKRIRVSWRFTAIRSTKYNHTKEQQDYGAE